MKLNEYIKQLQEVKRKHGNLECIYSIDDEGNDFHSIHYSPTPMNDEKGEYGMEKVHDNKKPIYVCVN